jgi:hypothetical protein
MEVDSKDTVSSVMQMIQEKEGIPVDQQSLIFAAVKPPVDAAPATNNPIGGTDFTGGSSELFSQNTDGSYVPDWSQASSTDQNHNKEQLWMVKLRAILSLFR